MFYKGLPWFSVWWYDRIITIILSIFFSPNLSSLYSFHHFNSNRKLCETFTSIADLYGNEIFSLPPPACPHGFLVGRITFFKISIFVIIALLCFYLSAASAQYILTLVIKLSKTTIFRLLWSATRPVHDLGIEYKLWILTQTDFQ